MLGEELGELECFGETEGLVTLAGDVVGGARELLPAAVVLF